MNMSASLGTRHADWGDGEDELRSRSLRWMTQAWKTSGLDDSTCLRDISPAQGQAGWVLGPGQKLP